MTRDALLELEAGKRVHAAMRAENFGLYRQRLVALLRLKPVWGWMVVREGGVPVRMQWVGFS